MTTPLPLKGTLAAAKAIERVSYTHDAMIDLILTHPGMPKMEIGRYFGYSEGWVSQVMNSDAFMMRMAERKQQLVDPTLVLSVEERFKGLVHQSMDIIADKLTATKSADLALATLNTATKALGFGARAVSAPQVQNNFIVTVPAKAASTEEWLQSNSRTIDVTPEKSSDAA